MRPTPEQPQAPTDSRHAVDARPPQRPRRNSRPRIGEVSRQGDDWTMLRDGESLKLGYPKRTPLRTAAQVENRWGRAFSGLQLDAAIQLPSQAGYYNVGLPEGGKVGKLIYCFSKMVDLGERGQERVYFLMGQTEIDHLQETNGRPRPEVADRIIMLSRGGDSESKVLIGRNQWLPGVGYRRAALDEDGALRADFGRTSHKQTWASVDPDSMLRITDAESYNGTIVYHGAPELESWQESPTRTVARAAIAYAK